MLPRYNVIYADPPWDFKVWSKATGSGRSAESHYPTMTGQDLRNLPVEGLAADDCALFLWAVMPKLDEALWLMHCWGFDYKTVGFTWMKTNPKSGTPFTGLGYWTRANAELCLLGTRGRPKRIHKGVSQAVLAPVTRHSAKPHEVRDRIVKLMGDVPRIELFARERCAGWDAIGNELDGRDIREVLRPYDQALTASMEEQCARPLPRSA